MLTKNGIDESHVKHSNEKTQPELALVTKTNNKFGADEIFFQFFKFIL